MAEQTLPTRPVSARPIFSAPQALAWASVVIVILLWEAIVRIAHLNPIYLPAPSGIVRALIDLFANGKLGIDLLATLWRIFAGFAIAVVLGVFIGVWMATSERMRAIA